MSTFTSYQSASGQDAQSMAPSARKGMTGKANTPSKRDEDGVIPVQHSLEAM